MCVIAATAAAAAATSHRSQNAACLIIVMWSVTYFDEAYLTSTNGRISSEIYKFHFEITNTFEF